MARKALIHQVEARERRGRWFGALASLLSISLLMSGWVALFMFLGTNSAYGSFEQIKDDWVPDTSAMPLNLPTPAAPAASTPAPASGWRTCTDGRNGADPLRADPEVMVHAILAAEDSDFFEHGASTSRRSLRRHRQHPL